MTPVISVVIPNYNREKTIQRAIKSVLDQTEQNFELIIVDDLSTDNSVQKICEIKDDRIKLIKLDKNSGAARARNIGVKHSKAKLISFLDSDDSFEPEFLNESVQAMERSDDSIGFMWTGVTYIYINSVKNFSWKPKRRKNTYETFLYNLQIGSGAGITIDKSVFENAGYFKENLPAAEDTEFFLRISKKYDYTFSERNLINIYKGDNDRLSGNFKKIAKAYNDFLPQHFDAINESIQLKKKFYYKMTWLNYHLPNKIKARKYFHMIPKKGVKDIVKFYLVFFLYELLPVSTAYKFHRKFSN